MRDRDMLGICMGLRMDMSQENSLWCAKLWRKIKNAKCLRFSSEDSLKLQKVYDKVVKKKYVLTSIPK